MIDFQILSILQKDATLPVKDIAKKVGLSNTPCWSRMQKLQERLYSVMKSRGFAHLCKRLHVSHIVKGVPW